MNQPPATRTYKEKQAGSLQAGDFLVLPDGERSAEVQKTDVETDDFGNPAVVLATITGGDVLRIAAASTVRLVGSGVETVKLAVIPPAASDAVVPPLPAPPAAAIIPSEKDLSLIPAPEGSPESVVEAAAQAHPGAAGV